MLRRNKGYTLFISKSVSKLNKVYHLQEGHNFVSGFLNNDQRDRVKDLTIALVHGERSFASVQSLRQGI